MVKGYSVAGAAVFCVGVLYLAKTGEMNVGSLIMIVLGSVLIALPFIEQFELSKDGFKLKSHQPVAVDGSHQHQPSGNGGKAIHYIIAFLIFIPLSLVVLSILSGSLEPIRFVGTMINILFKSYIFPV